MLAGDFIGALAFMCGAGLTSAAAMGGSEAGGRRCWAYLAGAGIGVGVGSGGSALA